MQTIQNDIRSGNLKRAYLLFGEELYLMHTHRDSLIRAMNPEDDSMNFTRFEGKEINVNAIIDKAEELPFFADYRTILICDSGFFKSEQEKFCNYMKNPCETTGFIFVEKEVDKRNSLYKIIKNLGNAIEFKTQNEQLLQKWVLQRLGKEGKRITGSAMEEFFLRTGSDMNTIDLELEKLISYTYGRDEVFIEDVVSIVTKRVTSHIFDMITAIGLKQQQKALHLYYELIAAKEPPLKILALLVNQFNNLLQTQELRAKGYDKGGIAEKLGKQTFVIGKFLQQSSMFTKEDLKKALEDCLEAEEQVKTGQMADRLAVEIIIVKYSYRGKVDDK